MAEKRIYITPIILKQPNPKKKQYVRQTIHCMEGHFDYRTRVLVQEITLKKGLYYYNYKDWNTGMGYDFTEECVRENDSFIITGFNLLGFVDAGENGFRSVDGDVIYAMYNLVNIADDVVTSPDAFLTNQSNLKLADIL